MPRHAPPRHRRARLRAAAAVAALLLPGLLAPPAQARGGPVEGPTAHLPAAAAAGRTATRAQAARIDAYWTAARLRAARPIPLPTRSGIPGPTASVAASEAPLPPRKGDGASPTAPHQPGGGGPDGGHRSSSAPAARRWGSQGTMPARTTGKLYFTTPMGDASCTATVINSPHRNTVWTAGHCVHPAGGGAGAYYDDFMFVPDADNGQDPHGRWTFRFATTPQAWQESGDWHYDMAALAFYPQQDGGNLADRLGAQGYYFGGGTDFPRVVDFGYPSDGYRRSDFTGRNLWYCEGPTSAVSTTDDLMTLRCDMGHGCSGGPWIVDLQADRGWGYIVGTNSHRDIDTAGGWADDRLYSASHGNAAIHLYDEVSRH
ncbi:trypsin-like serine peptidase [Peterkaempfera griseoplana]|uniref:trypsin-like serine peptidase n=1 Tax=Peterkaempfera griseoplana TaxID=66896 RepID=UPI0006E15036|nr:hypothetical protein [Peterkaempfera griseoplana]